MNLNTMMRDGMSAAIGKSIDVEMNKMIFEETYKNKAVMKPNVCCMCDGLLKVNEIERIPVTKLKASKAVTLKNYRAKEQDFPKEIAKSYIYYGPGHEPWMKTHLLSPRSCFERETKSFLCCQSCKHAAERKTYGVKCINNFMIGQTPLCLAELTDIELAFISPIRTHGHLFMYRAGKSRKMCGFHSFMKLDVQKVFDSIRLIDSFLTVKNIAVVLSGPFTPEQVERKKRSCTIRTDKVVAALKWLRLNNKYYRELAELDINTLAIPKIQILDDTTHDESENEAIESIDEFRVVFPDGIVNNQNGGHDNIAAFKKTIQELRQNESTMKIFSRSLNEVAPDYKDDNLVLAFPKAFPYGYGGPQDKRRSVTPATKVMNERYGNIELSKYLEHVSCLSRAEFHENLFALVLYNIHTKQKLVHTAIWKGHRDNDLVEAVAKMNGETLSNIADAQKYVTHGLNADAKKSMEFYSLLDVISKYLPHTNGASSTARGNVEALCHSFGQMSYFLTVTPDEENCIELQVLAGKDIDLTDGRDISSLSADELREKAIHREKISVGYPGFAAHYFEQIVDIVMDKIVGWDLANNCAHESGGLFGTPRAYVTTVEEQGRTRLHVHIGIWVDDIQKVLETLFSTSNDKCRQDSKVTVANMMDKIGSTTITDDKEGFSMTNLPEATCIEIDADASMANEEGQTPNQKCIGSCTKFHTVPNQQLRNMRHKEGSQIYAGHIANCTTCNSRYRSTEIAVRTLEKEYAFGPLCQDPQNISASDNKYTTDKLNAILLRVRRNSFLDKSQTLVTNLANYARNTHSILHHQSCFKYDTECRYNLCKLPCKKTKVVDTERQIDWYNWDGTSSVRNIYEIREKRSIFDLYANSYCKAVSNSNLHCNSNIRLLMPGPATVYTTKYLTKDTQKEDESPYKRMCEYMQNRFNKTNKLTDRSEGLSRLIAASFVHNSKNVIGATMAKYLTLNKSRFSFSHEFVFIDAVGLLKVMRGEQIQTIVRRHNAKTYLENYAYHYLYRPRELFFLSPKRFFEQYEVIRNPPKAQMEKDKENYYFFSNDLHPGKHYQVIRRRTMAVLAKIRTYDFPDSRKFNGDIMETTTEITEDTEQYAKMALLHFSSYDSNIDSMLHEGSYTKKLRQIVYDNNLFDQDGLTILQNVQEIRNNFKVPRCKDELTAITNKFVGSGGLYNDVDQDHLAAKEAENERAALFAELLFQNSDSQVIPEDDKTEPSSLCLNELVRKSGDDSLINNTLGPIKSNTEPHHKFIMIDNTVDTEERPKKKHKKDKHDEIPAVKREHLVQLLARRVHRTTTADCETGTDKNILANGSAESIVAWSNSPRKTMGDDKAHMFDTDQKRAFQVLVGHFVMTYLEEAEHNHDSRKDRQTFLNYKEGVSKLINRRRQLIMFFSGAGGSGKSAVIKQILIYASEFCDNLGVPFDRYTIRVTAITGVAAASINGETLDPAAHLMKNYDNLGEDHVKEYKYTRLLIIDEISFMSIKKLEHLDRVMRKLREHYTQLYGGINIVFCGDFRQLEPFGAEMGRTGDGKRPIYAAEGAENRLFYDAVNCYLELKGLHRFENDLFWGNILRRLREGTMTLSDIRFINRRVVNRSTSLPPNLRYGTFFNKQRDTINTRVFMTDLAANCKDDLPSPGHLIILCDHLQYKFSKDSAWVDFKHKQEFWSKVGESDCECGQSDGRIDPMLKLYVGCEVMHVTNKLDSGLANGTQLQVHQVVLHSGMGPTVVKINGVPCNTVRASAVKHVILRQEIGSSGESRFFKTEATLKSFKAKFPVPDAFAEFGFNSSKLKNRKKGKESLNFVRGLQFPFVVNSATTGFKLQGASVNNIYVVDNQKGRRNWIYVLLSRVRSVSGLFLKEPIPSDLDYYAIPAKLARLLLHFDKTCVCPEAEV